MNTVYGTWAEPDAFTDALIDALYAYPSKGSKTRDELPNRQFAPTAGVIACGRERELNRLRVGKEKGEQDA